MIESMTQQGSRPTAGRVTLHYAGCLTDMSFRRLVFLLTLCSVAAFPGTAAGAAMQRLKLHVSPAGEIRLDQAVTVTWRTDATLTRNQAYQATFAGGQPSSSALPCVRTHVRLVGRGSSRGSLMRVRFTPPSSGGAGLWCASRYPAFIYIVRVEVAADGRPDLSREQTLANVGQAGPLTLVPRRAKVVLLPGSTLKATVPERPVRPAGPAHPDRSTVLTGTLRGTVFGRFAPSADSNTANVSGTITPTSFAADPLCPSAAPPGRLNVAASTLDVAITGAVSLNLVVKGGASQLFGCGPAGPLTGTTTIPLSGRSGPQGLKRLALNGRADDILLPDGAKAALSAALVVSVDLSGRP